MRGRAGLALLCAVLAGSAAAKDSLTLCFERQDVLPWRTVNGSGLDFELLKLAAAKTDVSLEFQSMPWKRCLEQVKANEVSGAFGVSYNPERASLGAFPGGAGTPDASKRLHTDRYVLLRKKGSKVEWDGKAFRHLQGAVGAQLGYSVNDLLRSMKVPVDEGSQRAAELAQKLIAGRISAAAMGGGDASALMNGPLAGELELLPLPLVEKPYFLVFSRALAEANPALTKRFWNAIEEARNGAAYKKMQREANEGGTH